MPDSIDTLNWINDNGELEFRPRLRDNLQRVSRITMAVDKDAPEIDEEYDCD